MEDIVGQLKISRLCLKNLPFKSVNQHYIESIGPYTKLTKVEIIPNWWELFERAQ
jgi:hypothetical protein